MASVGRGVAGDDWNDSEVIRIGIIGALSISITCCLPAVGQQRIVAITFDDLPIAETDIPAVGEADSIEAKSINRAILDSLRRHKAPATGFVIEKRVEDVGEIPGREILWRWVESGNDLGNHSYSHPDFNQLTIEQMEQEIVSGEKSLSKILQKVGRTPRYFRFPMNHTGDTAAKHDAVAAFLTQRGYKLAVCTIDNEDYVFDRAYLLALARKDSASAERLRSEYLSYTGTEIDYYSSLNKQVFGYEPPQVMLLHVNRLNADTINSVLGLFEQRHYAFVDLDKAEADPAFAVPDKFVTPYGWMWGYRWARERHIKVNGNLETEPAAWVRDYGKQ
jgi:peptidoglycan/xylan/chitin deacetylase (PgdA/CDA1 family)